VVVVRRALIVIDMQNGFDDETYWGQRNNPACLENVEFLMSAWRSARQPIVRVIHDSQQPDSPLRPGQGGHDVMPVASGPVDLEVHKSAHSAFHGTPDLNRWLQEGAVSGIAVCGITTNMCCETTARVGSDLGYDLWFLADATATFDLVGTDGSVVTAAQLTRATTAVLAADFGRVVETRTACALASVASGV